MLAEHQGDFADEKGDLHGQKKVMCLLMEGCRVPPDCLELWFATH